MGKRHERLMSPRFRKAQFLTVLGEAPSKFERLAEAPCGTGSSGQQNRASAAHCVRLYNESARTALEKAALAKGPGSCQSPIPHYGESHGLYVSRHRKND
jgi:hypothetical protein